VQTLTIEENVIHDDLKQAMNSLEILLNEDDPSYIINAIKYYNAHKKLDKDTLKRINCLLTNI
jgi:hypothetical protein